MDNCGNLGTMASLGDDPTKPGEPCGPCGCHEGRCVDKCCGDRICDVSGGEDCLTCPGDCGAILPEVQCKDNRRVRFNACGAVAETVEVCGPCGCRNEGCIQHCCGDGLCELDESDRPETCQTCRKDCEVKRDHLVCGEDEEHADGAVYWFSNCEEKQEDGLVEVCGVCGCEDGEKCVAVEPQHEKRCEKDSAHPDGAVWWYNNCDQRQDDLGTVETCNGCGCDGDKCDTTSHCCNGTCEPELGENCKTCGSECGCAGVCQPDGSCCTPNCDGKECGDNGCGGQCSPGCTGDNVCQSGVCVELPSCGRNGCQSDKGENCSTCPQDCRCDQGVCVDGECRCLWKSPGKYLYVTNQSDDAIDVVSGDCSCTGSTLFNGLASHSSGFSPSTPTMLSVSFHGVSCLDGCVDSSLNYCDGSSCCILFQNYGPLTDALCQIFLDAEESISDPAVVALLNANGRTLKNKVDDLLATHGVDCGW